MEVKGENRGFSCLSWDNSASSLSGPESETVLLNSERVAKADICFMHVMEMDT